MPHSADARDPLNRSWSATISGWFVIAHYLLFAHDLFGKPASTFPDHALSKPTVA
jgi:hypothetical protein